MPANAVDADLDLGSIFSTEMEVRIDPPHNGRVRLSMIRFGA